MIPPELPNRNGLAYRAAGNSSGPIAAEAIDGSCPDVDRAVGRRVQRDRGAGHGRRAARMKYVIIIAGSTRVRQSRLPLRGLPTSPKSRTHGQSLDHFAP
jgi:hypothetical protein